MTTEHPQATPTTERPQTGPAASCRVAVAPTDCCGPPTQTDDDIERVSGGEPGGCP